MFPPPAAPSAGGMTPRGAAVSARPRAHPWGAGSSACVGGVPARSTREMLVDGGGQREPRERGAVCAGARAPRRDWVVWRAIPRGRATRRHAGSGVRWRLCASVGRARHRTRRRAGGLSAGLSPGIWQGAWQAVALTRGVLARPPAPPRTRVPPHLSPWLAPRGAAAPTRRTPRRRPRPVAARGASGTRRARGGSPRGGSAADRLQPVTPPARGLGGDPPYRCTARLPIIVVCQAGAAFGREARRAGAARGQPHGTAGVALHTAWPRGVLVHASPSMQISALW